MELQNMFEDNIHISTKAIAFQQRIANLGPFEMTRVLGYTGKNDTYSKTSHRLLIGFKGWGSMSRPHKHAIRGVKHNCTAILSKTAEYLRSKNHRLHVYETADLEPMSSCMDQTTVILAEALGALILRTNVQYGQENAMPCGLGANEGAHSLFTAM